MATIAQSLPKTKGGSFLIEDREPSEIFTPEDLTEEHRLPGDDVQDGLLTFRLSAHIYATKLH